MRKSLEAVFSPHKFTPYIITQQMDFDELWKTNQSLLFSGMAHIAYFNKKKAANFLKQLKANSFYFYDCNGAQAFLAIWQDKAILAFRGTQPSEAKKNKWPKLGFFRRLKLNYTHHLWLDAQSSFFINNDILADLKLIPTKFDEYDDVVVHSGFLEELNKLWPEIKKDIEKHVAERPIWTTGHSLGGAISTLAAMRYPFENVITFGEPRVGSNIGAAFKAKNHLRYVNGKDPVPTVPPEFIFAYKHHGTEKNIIVKNGEADIRFDHSIIFYSENLI